MRLFAYGTLEHAPLIFKLVKHPLRATAATLEGYACYYLRGKNFPGLGKKRNAVVVGTLYSGLTYRDLKRIDKYEHDFYVRRKRNIQTSDDLRCQAFVYFVRPFQLARLSKRPWRRTGRRDTSAALRVNLHPILPREGEGS